MIIKNGLIFNENCQFEKGTIETTNDRISVISTDENFVEKTSSKSEDTIDATGMYVIPGLTDLHFHGCAGHDFCDATEEAIQAIADYELSVGVTQICPATMTFSEEKIMEIGKAAKEHNNEKGATLCGINMEGPFISPEKKGAQNGTYIHNPDADMFHRLQNAAGGLFKIVDLAVEEPGAKECIEKLKDEVVLSFAHSTADYETASAGFEAGVTHVTHLYNAMTGFSHRAPGAIGAAFDHDFVHVELICDGVHVHPAAIRATFQLFTDDRIILISDSMMATGLKDGEYSLGGQDVTVKGKYATLHDGTIAGSATNLFDCMTYVVKTAKLPLETAVKCATKNPAKEIGIFDDFGSISIGKKANLLLLDKDLNLKHVIFNGELQ